MTTNDTIQTVTSKDGTKLAVNARPLTADVLAAVDFAQASGERAHL